MSIGWNFPSNNYGTVTGIGEASIETFRGSPYRSLAREICQNSMDARADLSKPVMIDFSSFSLAVRAIPDYGKLHEAINLCLEFWTKQKNQKTITFFNKAKSIMDSGFIDVLRISDFNTKGLQGSEQEYNTPWHNLVKAAGVSGKDGSDGGSYGIGKAAPFACSDIRTLFYATKDIDGLSAFQGIAKLVSFQEKTFLGKDKDSITSGTGYYAADKKNSPIRQCISIDPSYNREEIGTDIFVLGFHKNSDWKSEIIISILEEFLLAIYNNELIIRIDGTEISSRTLESLIDTYKDTAKIAYNYYQVLTNEKTVVIENEFPGLGTIELRILIQQDLHRKVMMCRKNGMKIFDKANISGTIQFAGICLLKDDQINEYFREMENPQHNAWEPERHTKDSKTKAKNNMSMLYKFVRNSVLDLGKKTTVDQVDAVGMGEYFADTDEIDTDNQKKDEAISSRTSNIEINVTKQQKEKMGYEVIGTADSPYPEEPDQNGSSEDYGNTGAKDSHDDAPNRSHIGTGFGNGEGQNAGPHGKGHNLFSSNLGSFDDSSRTTNIGTMSVRLFLTDKNTKTYTLVFIPQRNSGKGFLEINLSGEQNNIKTSVLSATDLQSNAELSCQENRIYLDNVERGHKNKISFRIEYAEECSLEVKLYGYSS